MKNMKTLIVDLDLSKQPPHSPRARIGGFALACRAVDKCRASLAGTIGEYHYDCPLDEQLFRFKGITCDQFTAAVKDARSYDEVGVWLLQHGEEKTGPEIEDWSEDQEGDSLFKNPEKRAFFVEDCNRLGLDPTRTTTFDWLEADDRFSFRRPTD
jgi:hypothetical protein